MKLDSSFSGVDLSLKEENMSNFSEINTTDVTSDVCVVVNNEDVYSNSSLLDMYDEMNKMPQDELNKKMKIQLDAYSNENIPNCDHAVLNNMQNCTEYGFVIPETKHYKDYTTWYNNNYKDDVSWGTKGSTKEEKPKSEAVITAGPDGKTVITGTEWPQDIDRKYIEVRNRLKETETFDIKVDQNQKNTDYYRDVRTRIVTFWMLSNLILCMIITQIYGPEDMYKNKYLVFILISVASLALFRAFFSTLFLVMKYIRSIISFINKYQRNGGVNIELPKWMGKFKKSSKTTEA